MQIYFARSIRGAHTDADQDTNRAIAATIKSAGFTLAMESHAPKRDPNWDMNQYIHERDLWWIAHSHALIAEVTNPSLGVGYEIAYARFVTQIPVLAVAVKDEPVSAMIGGGVRVTPYRDTGDLTGIIREWLYQQFGDSRETPADVDYRKG